VKLASFETIVQALNEAGVRYLVVGGIAVNAYGYGRSTFDVDVVVGFDGENVSRAFRALGAIGYRPQQPVTAEDFGNAAKRESWRADKGMVVLKFWSDAHRDTPLNLFVHEPFDFAVEWENASRQELGPGMIVPIVRLETLLAMKREAGRPKDLADLDELGLLYGQPSSYDDKPEP
jgi:predicted nucleotidyltransferase